MPIAAGDTVPSIQVPSYSRGRHNARLMGPEDHRGRWVVLVFYPRDLNFVCPTELVELADLTPAFMDEKVSDGSAGRPAAETLRVVRALRTGELRPASRQPGQPYLLAA